jgi:putative membrane protein
MPSLDRWFPSDPRRVGTDPDYRFSMANERTFLAWIRTSLALAAGGLAAIELLDELPLEQYVGVALLLLSFITAAASYRRWALNERAMRLEETLPHSRLPLVMTVAVSVGALIGVVVVVWEAAQ